MDQASAYDEFEARVALLQAELDEARESVGKLRDALESASLGLLEIDGAGVINSANQAAIDLLGYSPVELPARNIPELRLAHEASGPGRLRSTEIRLRHEKGTVRCVQVSSDGSGGDETFAHANLILTDVTAIRHRETRLLLQSGVAQILASATNFQDAGPALLKQVGTVSEWRTGYLWIANVGLLRCAASWTGADDQYKGFSDLCDGTPTASETLPGRIWTSRKPQWIEDFGAHPEFPSREKDAWYGLRSAFGFPILVGDETRAVMEFFTDEVRSPDPELLELAAAIGCQVGEFYERAETRQRQAEREASYRVQTETAADGIVTLDGNLRILFANTPAAAMFGYTRAELIGTSIEKLIQEQARDIRDAAIWNHTANKDRDLQSPRILPLTGVHREGFEFPLEASLGVYEQGSERAVVAVFRDTRERTKLEEKVREAAKRESLGVLAGGIAHDFNNLLTTILGNISLAGDLVGPDHEVRKFLSNAIEGSQKASLLIRQMLAYAGRGKFVVEPIDISELVSSITPLAARSLPEHVTLRFELSSSLPRVEVDGAQIQQLVMNLITNAAEAVPPGRKGIVLVKTRLRRVNGGEEAKPGLYVAVTVQDNGSGMDEETKGKVFDPFFSTKFTGRGLGLAAALGIVSGHRGMMSLFSAPGMGTTFRVLLPAALEPEFAEGVEDEPA